MIASPAAIAPLTGEEDHDPFYKVKLPNREMIGSTPRASHKLKIKHHVGDVQYLRYFSWV
jgi:hypothetical protein